MSTATTARDPADGVATHARVELPRLPAAIEAVLLASDVPIPVAVLADLFEVDDEQVHSALTRLAADHTAHGHGFGVVAVAGGWRLSTLPEFAPWLERHLGAGQRVRLSRAAVETLTVVAYQQPVTRALVSSVRGVASDGVLRTLVAHGMVEECGADGSGALRYRTTRTFLEKMGADGLDDLPPLAPHLPDLPPPAPDLPRPSDRPDPDPVEASDRARPRVPDVAAPVTADRQSQEMP